MTYTLCYRRPPDREPMLLDLHAHSPGEVEAFLTLHRPDLPRRCWSYLRCPDGSHIDYEKGIEKARS